MMDDINPPRRPERRDYTVPVRRAAASVPRPQPAPGPSPPTHHQPASPVYHPPLDQRSANQPASNPTWGATQPYHRPVVAPAAHHHQPPQAPAKFRHPGLKYLAAGVALVVAVGLFTAGYVFKSKTPSNSLPAAVVTKANFSVYFPSPMPGGYMYIDKTATFQIGDVFYRFANGQKSVTVREEPISGKKPDLALYKNYTLFNAAVGQAAIGSTFGEPVAIIVTPTTVITMNTSGGVTSKDLKTAINNLHNIGSSSQATNNG